jgi:hypothetical protein
MKPAACVPCVLIVAAVCGRAAEGYPSASVFLGACFSRFDRGRIADSILPAAQFPDRSESFTGFHFSPSISVRRWLRVVITDFAGQYRSAGVKLDGSPDRSRAFQLMFGPEFVKRSKPVTLFAHSLIGLAYVGRYTVIDGHGNTERDSGVLAAFGGGLDVKLTRSLGLRVAQFDFLPGRVARGQDGVDPVAGLTRTSVSRTASENWRISFGLLIDIWN